MQALSLAGSDNPPPRRAQRQRVWKRMSDTPPHPTRVREGRVRLAGFPLRDPDRIHSLVKTSPPRARLHPAAVDGVPS